MSPQNPKMRKNNKIIAGYIINLLMLSYLTLGVVLVLRNNVSLGIVYIAVIGFSFILCAYFWCGKCPCRLNACTHLWLGKLTKFLPQRTPGEYTFGDKVGTWLYIIGLHGIPQYWLWQQKALFGLFWGLALATFLVGPLYACKSCQHAYCPLKNI
jgi:hypothetical protein